MNTSKGKYFVKRNDSDSFADITTLFNGVAVLSVDGFNERGEALNVYHEQWIDSQKEDFLVTKKDDNDNDVIIRGNVDLSITLCVSKRYRTGGGNFNEINMYDSLIDYFCNKGAFYLKSTFVNKTAKVVCLSSVKPTSQKLNRDVNGYILVTIPLHVLDEIV